MAIYQDVLISAGRMLAGAEVTIYVEDSSKSAAGFGDSDKATIYQDSAMATEENNPLTADSTGTFKFYMPSYSRVMIKVSKGGFGTTYRRNVDIVGADG